MSSSEPAAPGIFLKPGREGPVRRRHHPWIYSQAVLRVEQPLEPGALAPIRSSDGALLGWGHYSSDSLIAVRMVSYGPSELPADWLEQRLIAASAMRESLGIDSDACRLVNAEGDFLPGLVVDRYADTAVISAHTRGMEVLVPRVCQCLRDRSPGLRVYLRRDEHFARVEKLQTASGYLAATGDGTTVIREGGVPLKVDFVHGQKTGFYLDQRANRSRIAQASRGRTVLNLFSYSGAVALRAAAAGAARVVSVDSSRAALDLAAESARLSPDLPAERLEWVQGDVFSFLETPGQYDIVVADPPPFARRRSELDGALQGYLTLFTQCLRMLSPGGLAFFFSCSGAVDRPTFQHVVAEAFVRSGRQGRLLSELHADVDHPVSSSHPEGEYLKGWMVHAQ
ncbi:MAG TPA: class I SAM-dependent rRNA methyltransferase [Spirochaetia bacterium]|nr:class I SAM-dependent rRNA methyltransferase [Spirochaetia bacterium]